MRRSFVSVIFVVGLAAAGCSSEGHTAVSAQTPTPGRGGAGGGNVPVAVGKVVQKTMPIDLRIIGAVEPEKTVEIRAQITGQLMTVGFKEGDDVKQGDVLFTLDRRPLDAALNMLTDEAMPPDVKRMKKAA